MLRWGMAVIAVLAMAAGVSQSQAAVVAGKNTISDSRKGKLYIPAHSSVSGCLGQTCANGKCVGMRPDRVSLSGAGESCGGWADITFNYELPLRPETAQFDQAKILIDVTDLDFRGQVIRGNSVLHERIEFYFLPDGGQPVGPPDFVLHDGNYGYFRPDSFLGTDKKKVTYSIPLSALGLTAEDIADVYADQGFSILMCVESDVTHYGTVRTTFSNTVDVLKTGFDYEPEVVPEPATVGLILLGAPLLILRRRRCAA